MLLTFARRTIRTLCWHCLDPCVHCYYATVYEWLWSLSRNDGDRKTSLSCRVCSVSRADAVFESHFILGDTNVQQWREHSAVHNVMVYLFIYFCSFLAFLLEVHNPGYSHYKSCLLDLRPQTGDRLCNLVSFSIPLGFMGRCLTLQAGYLLATLKATFFLLTSHLGSHTYNVCMETCKKREKKKQMCSQWC